MDGLRKDSMERVDRWIDGEHMIWKGLIDGQKGYGTEQINLIKPKEF